MKRYDFEAEARSAGCSVERAKAGIMLGEELIKRLSLEEICEPGRKYPKEIDALSEAITNLQRLMRNEDGISFEDSGKALIAIGLAAWAADLHKERRHHEN